LTSNWEGKNVLVTGGAGFIGSHLVETLIDLGSNVSITVLGKEDGNLFLSHVLDKINIIEGDLTKPESCLEATKNIDRVFHLAGLVRGVGYNASHPAELLTSNVLMNIQMLEAARKNDVNKYLFMSSACGYPLEAPVPLEETYFFEGEPEPTNGTYGHAKRIGEIQASAYKEEYGMKIAIARPFNAYGPRDNFDPKESHVIPALIKKSLERIDPFLIWGDGKATRAFIYVSDIVKGLLLLLEKYAVCDPLNLGTDEEISVKDLAFLILNLSGYLDAKVEFQSDKPAGQPRRSASIKKAKEKIGFVAKVKLENGILETIKWYKDNRI